MFSAATLLDLANSLSISAGRKWETRSGARTSTGRTGLLSVHRLISHNAHLIWPSNIHTHVWSRTFQSNTGYSLVHVNRNKFITRDISEEIQCQLPLHIRMSDERSFFILIKFSGSFNKTVTHTFYTHGGETWSVTLRKQNGLIVLWNRVLSRMVGPIRNPVIIG
jgi:hypothetical protein